MTAPIWLALSEGRMSAWQTPIEAAGHPVTPLPVSRLAPPRDAALLRRALRARAHDLLLLTSPNAVAYVEPTDAAGWTAACVGPRTAHAAAGAGIDVAFTGSAGVEALVAGLLERAPGIEQVLYLRGRFARDEGTALLRAAGRHVDEVEAYVLDAHPELARRLARAEAPAAVVVGSPRAADLLLEAGGASVRAHLEAARVVAFGATTLGHLHGLGFPDARLAERPDPGAVLAAL